jgi:hypothetical protein
MVVGAQLELMPVTKEPDCFAADRLGQDGFADLDVRIVGSDFDR